MISPLYHKLLEMIRAGEFARAEEGLELWDTTDRNDLKMKMHLHGKIKLMRNQFDAAIEIFNETISHSGSHVILRSDLAAAYYLTQRYGLWKQNLDLLLVEYHQSEECLDPAMAWRIQIIIAKFLEEAADLWGAQTFLKLAAQNEDLVFQQKAKTQLLRLESQYRLSHDLFEPYTKLRQINLDRENKDYVFELTHALAIAEAELSSSELAVQSLKQLDFIDEISKSLIVFDLAEIYFRNTGQISVVMTDFLEKVRPNHVYEQKLLRIMRSQDCSDWYEWAGKMPLGNYLRLMTLLLSASWFSEKDLATHQWKMIVNGLSKKNKNTWNLLVKQKEISTSVVTLNSLRSHAIQVNRVTINLERKHLLWEFVKIIEKYPRISDIDLCRKLWNTDLTESYAARLRQLVKRLNQLTMKNASVEVCVYHQGTLHSLVHQ